MTNSNEMLRDGEKQCTREGLQPVEPCADADGPDHQAPANHVVGFLTQWVAQPHVVTVLGLPVPATRRGDAAGMASTRGVQIVTVVSQLRTKPGPLRKKYIIYFVALHFPCAFLHCVVICICLVCA